MIKLPPLSDFTEYKEGMHRYLGNIYNVYVSNKGFGYLLGNNIDLLVYDKENKEQVLEQLEIEINELLKRLQELSG